MLSCFIGTFGYYPPTCKKSYYHQEASQIYGSRSQKESGYSSMLLPTTTLPSHRDLAYNSPSDSIHSVAIITILYFSLPLSLPLLFADIISVYFVVSYFLQLKCICCFCCYFYYIHVEVRLNFFIPASSLAYSADKRFFFAWICQWLSIVHRL